MTADLSDSSLGGPSAALLLARGICRALDQLGYASLAEFPLANGQRADILALGKSGDLVIVEIKSSVADFRADRKWTGYREFADRLYFAVPNEFPAILIPEECGLMVADAFGAGLLRDGITTPLPPARRRAMTLRFARSGACSTRRPPSSRIFKIKGAVEDRIIASRQKPSLTISPFRELEPWAPASAGTTA